jgi:hypothetical protein
MMMMVTMMKKVTMKDDDGDDDDDDNDDDDDDDDDDCVLWLQGPARALFTPDRNVSESSEATEFNSTIEEASMSLFAVEEEGPMYVL